MKNIDLILKWTILIGIAVASISIAYYALWLLPAKELAQQERYRQVRVKDCLEKLNKENTPVMQKLVEEVISSSGTTNSKTMTSALKTFTAQWEGQKIQCKEIQ